MNPLVSVIIPSYNHARYIGRAIDSVLAQTYAPIELIVIDDGSRDDSAAVIAGLAQRHGFRAVLNPENRGQSHVVNQALDLCRGEFVCFLPSDDWYLPDKTRLQVDKFRDCDESTGVVYGRGARYYEHSDTTEPVSLPLRRGDVLRDLVAIGNFVYPVTPLFRRACFERVRFDESYRAEGEAIYLKLALHFRFDYVEDIVAVMRDHPANTGKNVPLMYRENQRYWEAFFDEPALPPEVRALRRTRLARLHRLKGLELVVLCGQARDGRRALRRAIGLRPRLLLDPRVLAGLVLSLLPAPLAGSLVRRRRGAAGAAS
ncbi:MAG TPA: glycosyltransferase [Tahibacter sp.]|uniref:glycosyltransferase family 2 protein n=1 Tax=Tahibacter sp. TaxID=2056211 RepID=UPI002C771486|nr:glycosyltransferase [Tahibacter sp.]HSX59236.1 glycosyltransferase [Tahibacter sp.]